MLREVDCMVVVVLWAKYLVCSAVHLSARRLFFWVITDVISINLDRKQVPLSEATAM